MSSPAEQPLALTDDFPQDMSMAYAEGYLVGAFFAFEVEAYVGESREDFLAGVAQRERDDYAYSLDVADSDSWPDEERR